jgi:hypothetical protein
MSTTIEAAVAANPTTQLKISAVVGNQLSVQYTGLPNNLPNSYGNYLVVWRNQDTIPWNNPTPDGFVSILGNNSQGSQVFENITVQVGVSYVVGYAVGPKSESGQTWRNVCSSGFVPVTGASTYLESSVSNVQPLTDSVSMDFQLPAGATPKTNGAWVGIWQSSQASYSTAPIASNMIGLDSSQGGAAINGVAILRGQVYTVALFTSGWQAGAGGSNVQTAMACTATFNT